MMEPYKCNFCRKTKSDTTSPTLVYHSQGGVSYACQECINSPNMSIFRSTEGKYYVLD